MFPTISTITNFNDVKRALDSIRSYFAVTPSVGNVNVTQPANSSRLTIIDGKELKVTEVWELRNVTGELENQVLDSTKMVEVFINGVRVKLAVLK